MRKQHFLWAYPMSEGTDSPFEERGAVRKVGKTENVSNKGSSAIKTEARFNNCVWITFLQLL